MSKNPLLEVKNLSVDAGEGKNAKCVLSNISFTLQQGEVLGVIGGSGASKPVLAKAIINWLENPLRATSGEVLFKGRNVLGLSAKESRLFRGKMIGYVGGNPTGALDPTATVGSQIVEKLRAVEPGVSVKAARTRVIDLLDAVKIPSATQRFNEYSFQFSGGMMQRAMIVDALISNPELIVADSITQPLDVTVGAQILKLLREVMDEFNTTIVFVSHSLPTVAELADQIIVLDNGQIVEQQATDKLISSPRSEQTRKLIMELPKLWEEGERPRLQSASAEKTPIMSVRNVSRYYPIQKRQLLGFGEKNLLKAVRNVDFDIYEGENFGIVGESGCGKSTLTRLLTALEPPDTGQIEFEGVDIFGRGKEGTRAFRRRMQLVLQDPFNSLPPRSSIGSIIGEPLIIHGIASGKQLRSQVLDVMAEVGLSARLYEELPNVLTAGQRQRVNVGRALILEPRLMLMDETLSSLGQSEQGEMLDLLERLQARHGVTYLFVSHDIAMVRKVCARVAVMYLGEVVELADNSTLFFDPGHPYSRALLSAAPTLEEKRYKTEECLLDGEPPSPINLPPGCAFASRCPNRFNRCVTENPRLLKRHNLNSAACFLLEEGANQQRMESK